MNCLIWVLLLLCCGNNGGCSDSSCNRDCRKDDRDCDCGCGRGRERNDCGCGNNVNSGCGNDSSDNDGCNCRPEFRPEPRFEQRPFMFNQNAGFGCEEHQNNCCDR